MQYLSDREKKHIQATVALEQALKDAITQVRNGEKPDFDKLKALQAQLSTIAADPHCYKCFSCKKEFDPDVVEHVILQARAISTQQGPVIELPPGGTSRIVYCSHCWEKKEGTSYLLER